MGKRKTHEQFIEEVYNLTKDEYTVLGTYYDSKEKIKVRHNKCGREYDVTPNSFLRGRRCKECSLKLLGDKKRKDPNTFVKEVFNRVGDEYTVMSEYTGAHDSILIRHNTCGESSKVRASDFLNSGSRCPVCFSKFKKTIKQFKKEVFDKVGDEYEVIGEYKETHTKTLMKHNICGHEYEVTPRKFLSGRRCPRCYGTPKKNTEEFIKEVYEIAGDEYTVLGEYEGNKVNILIKHNKCKHKYEVTPNSFLSHGNRCPLCSKSRGEKKIIDYCENNNINYKVQVEFDDCRNIRKLPFDIGIYDKNNKLIMLIEYHGEQHYYPIKHFDRNGDSFDERQRRDQIKRDYCKDNHIRVVEIPYTEYVNLEQVLYSLLSSINLV